MKRSHLFGLLLMSFAGHASAEKHYVVPTMPPMKVISFPAIDAESEVDVGESMVWTALKGVRPVIELKEQVSNVKIGVSFLSYQVSIPPGKFPMYDMGEKGTFYAAADATVAGLGDTYVGMIYVPKDDSKPREVCIRSGTFAKCEPVDTLGGKLALAATGIDEYAPKSFRKDLVFAGVSHNIVTILYREFVNDMARPAFSQELKYDISQDNVIGYRGARFQVIKAGNTGIRFKTLKHLNE